MKKRIKVNFGRMFLVLITIIAIICGITLGIKVANSRKVQPELGENNETKEEKVIPKDITINLVATGDIMCHKTNFKAAYNSQTKQYDFSPVFKNVAKYITKADIAIR